MSNPNLTKQFCSGLEQPSAHFMPLAAEVPGSLMFLYSLQHPYQHRQLVDLLHMSLIIKHLMARMEDKWAAAEYSQVPPGEGSQNCTCSKSNKPLGWLIELLHNRDIRCWRSSSAMLPNVQIDCCKSTAHGTSWVEHPTLAFTERRWKGECCTPGQN